MRCRACLAPVPAANVVVVRCACCLTPNVTGVDLRVRKEVRAAGRSLEQALEERASQRLQSRVVALVFGAPAFAGAIAILAMALRR